jgi:hypothetical protein
MKIYDRYVALGPRRQALVGIWISAVALLLSVCSVISAVGCVEEWWR